MKKRRGRAFWERIVALAEGGDETRAQLAKRHHVSLGTLQGWIYKVRREREQRGAESQTSAVRVLPITVTSSALTRRLSIHIAEARELCFEEGTSPDYISALVTALSRLGS